ncbi:MAG: hypothetical protein ACI92E_001698 [Oceanicoccus sp.]
MLSNVEHPLTLIASDAITTGNGQNMDEYRDYRGIDVIGVWTWDNESNFGLTSETDVAESYGAYCGSRTVFIATNLFTLFVIGFFIRVQLSSRNRLLKAHAELESQAKRRTQYLANAKLL